MDSQHTLQHTSMSPQSTLRASKDASWKRNPLSTLVVAAIIALLFGTAGGAMGGYFFGRKVIVQRGDEDIPLAQTVRVEEDSATIDAVEKVSPAVVSIIGEATKESQPVDFGFGFGFGFQQPQESSAGSGFILTADGLIATNKHVVSNRNLNYTVSLSDGRTFEVTDVSLDPTYDFAVVRVKADNLPFVELGSSDSLKIGERVIAIGNAVGEFQNTVTAGVVSARNRSIEASDGIARVELLEGLIQTDAAINLGNSGGPLINLSGQVIGVNTATDVGGENIGFAIPIADAKVAIESVIEKGKIERPMLGVRYVNLNKEVAELNGIEQEKGAYVVAEQGDAVIPSSPAEKLGLVEGDVILAIDEHEILPDRSLATILRQYRPGDEVNVRWLHDKDEGSGKAKLDSIGD